MKNKGFQGFDNFQLKYLALAFMLLDHIHYIFEFTGKIPEGFSMVGRLAAPLFLFCVIEGFEKTHDRKKYFLRIYVLSILMGLIRFGFYNVLSFAVRGDGFFPENAMLSSFVPLLAVLFGIRRLEEKKYVSGMILTVLPVILPFLCMPLYQIQDGIFPFLLNLVNFTVLPLHLLIQDGGTTTLITGVILYLFRKNRILQMVAFGGYVLIMDVALPLCMGISVHDLIFSAYEWMEIFSVPFMLWYNGKRGHGNKYLFYAFYPLHIYVLYGLSLLVFAWIG